MTGFKSFAEPEEVAIEDGMTGVVGPNGCGKSNIVEALRWLMGESSARNMRGNELEDVIFSGTASRPSRNFAEACHGDFHAGNLVRDEVCAPMLPFFEPPSSLPAG